MNNWILISIGTSLLVVYLIYLLLIKESEKATDGNNMLYFKKKCNSSHKLNFFFPKNNTTRLDLDYAHTIINHIGLNSSDDPLISQIKQFFIKNRQVTPDLIEHLSLHYNMTTDELYTLIHYIIKQPLKC